ncbi:MAG: hypothetical protein Q8S84_05080 [bacterium]|nr:hypothetical protein [bacterium]MDP3380868.1 hypothetical protein [bacterium]
MKSEFDIKLLILSVEYFNQSKVNVFLYQFISVHSHDIQSSFQITFQAKLVSSQEISENSISVTFFSQVSSI